MAAGVSAVVIVNDRLHDAGLAIRNHAQAAAATWTTLDCGAGSV